MGGGIDVDLVPRRADLEAIAGHLDQNWSEYLGLGQDLSHHGTFRFGLPGSTYEDPSAAPEDELGEAPDRLEEHFARHGLATAVLNPGTAPALSGMNATDLAIEFARATNQWTVEEWLERDPRLLGSIVVAPQDPDAAAAEIRRAARHPRMAQVTLARPRDFLGHRSLTPIFQAADELGLVVNLQGNAAFVGVHRGYAADGHPESMFEYRLTDTYGAQAPLISFISEGMPERYPNVRLVINGFGIAWLPSVVWAMDAHWHADAAARERIPRPPSEYVADFVRFGSRGLELPARHDELVELLSLVNGERLLMLSTSGGGMERFDAFDAPARARIHAENARDLYRSDERLGVAVPAAGGEGAGA
jgi:predicted TIM-barrel fold metal-dependent hydrolase